MKMHEKCPGKRIKLYVCKRGRTSKNVRMIQQGAVRRGQVETY